MLKRILLIWFVANFAIAGLFALLTGGWYLRLSTFAGIAAELGLVMLPNLLFPILLLRYGWPAPVSDLRQALGWQWKGWRPIFIGLIAFAIYRILSFFLSNILGPSIPYNLPGSEGGSIGGLAGILALLFFIGFVVITVMSEETMFRGLIQTQTSQSYGVWVGVLLTMVLFGLRHLPADIFYAHIWNATPRMWLARHVDLYLGAILLSLARYFGRSTYASATMHSLIFMLILVQGFI
ncbi:MAG: CPBP family intramembrane metalloprotease [Anaerolineales bacterium]|nr:CPBP family intramembrane metalloprotease [Anaerolineales bacterium]